MLDRDTNRRLAYHSARPRVSVPGRVVAGCFFESWCEDQTGTPLAELHKFHAADGLHRSISAANDELHNDVERRNFGTRGVLCDRGAHSRS